MKLVHCMARRVRSGLATSKKDQAHLQDRSLLAAGPRVREDEPAYRITVARRSVCVVSLSALGVTSKAWAKLTRIQFAACVASSDVQRRQVAGAGDL